MGTLFALGFSDINLKVTNWNLLRCQAQTTHVHKFSSYSHIHVYLISLHLTEIIISRVCTMFSTVTTGNIRRILEKIMKSVRLIFCVLIFSFWNFAPWCPLPLKAQVFLLWGLRPWFILFSSSLVSSSLHLFILSLRALLSTSCYGKLICI